ncbi:DUF2062 domain-containing protein [Vitiosangium sp. GDMCC 1.1324]|uniref:DUF2062 domain-containing protein n=1 Tax=Vitiosangium sp. (strain GDMCC 1.1324) TaxID=2138576 RepID=UPI00130ED6DA|nr:DUF2062 domain-containing protein [Vitiosangium sp. GDMCC 1.1324]
MSSWWKVAKRKLRRVRVRLLRGSGAPAEIAGGMALGLFIALLPIMGLQLPLALVIAELLRRLTHFQLSRVAAAAGVWLNNPVTAAPVYGLCYLVGRPIAHRLLPLPRQAEAGAAALDLGSLSFSGPDALELGLGLVIGGVLLGVPTAWLGYHITYGMVSRHQARRQERRARRARGLRMAPEA